MCFLITCMAAPESMCPGFARPCQACQLALQAIARCPSTPHGVGGRVVAPCVPTSTPRVNMHMLAAGSAESCQSPLHSCAALPLSCRSCNSDLPGKGLACCTRGSARQVAGVLHQASPLGGHAVPGVSQHPGLSTVDCPSITLHFTPLSQHFHAIKATQLLDHAGPSMIARVRSCSRRESCQTW
jgi:hypothetical protein